MSDSDVVDQYMFNTILTDFQYVIDLPLFSTSEYNILRINEPILMSISIIAPTGIFIIICKKNNRVLVTYFGLLRRCCIVLSIHAL